MRAFAFFLSFLLAFLLFSVQPMASKMVLPVLGGAPAVWNTAMLTFQLLLLAGYAYAHAVTEYVRAPRQWQVHALIIALSCIVLPLTVQLESSDALMRNPIAYLALALVLQVGLPFFCLSATAPLLQAWVSRSHHPLSRTPYVLYSASNLGSMAGLLGYVALVEPALALPDQAMAWSALYLGGMGALVVMGYLLRPQALPEKSDPAPATHPVGWRQMMLWVWLAFLPSSLSLGVTSYITTDIASVPLLWVLPLALYLLSFVDAFRTRPWLVGVCTRMAPLTGMAALVIYGSHGHQFSETFIFQLLVMGVLAFALHGWLARFKPPSAQLTRFYFCLSVGGALGGILNALVAPLIFTQTWEYPISLLLGSLTAFMLAAQHDTKNGQSIAQQLKELLKVTAAVLVNAAVFYVLLSIATDNWDDVRGAVDQRTLLTSASVATVVVVLIYRRYTHSFYALAALAMMLVVAQQFSALGTMRYEKRTFFGVVRVMDVPLINARNLIHNTTVHGTQPLVQAGALSPISYYKALTSSFEKLPVMRRHPFAAIGLGIGTVKCHASPEQRVDFYEINPEVVTIAENGALFTMLRDCPGTHRVFLGDGRITLAEREDGQYGAIILDAFTSDAIPTHLLTVEALQLYRQKLVKDGVLLVHVTNRHINLLPLLARQAESVGMVARTKFTPVAEKEKLIYASQWVILANRVEDIEPLITSEEGWQPLTPDAGARPWTDTYTNVIPYFKMFRTP